jgi:hypothetical protein
MTTAQDMLTKYLEAEQAVLEGKTITFEGRSMGMENLQEIIKGRQAWEKRVNAETDSTNNVRTFGGLRMGVARFDQ